MPPPAGWELPPPSILLSPPPAATTPSPPLLEVGWVVQPWSACSVPCGGGIATRTVACRYPDGTSAPESLCTSPKPATSIACNTVACETFAYVTGEWSPCSVSCGGGQKTRSVFCTSSYGYTVDDSLCSAAGLLKPLQVDFCGIEPCECNSVYFQLGEWGACSAPCDGGVQLRALSCVVEDINGATRSVAATVCGDTSDLILERLCNTQPCAETFGYQVGPWGECNATCGGGTFSRSLTCMSRVTGEPVDMAKCEGLTMPITSSACATQSCDGCTHPSVPGVCNDHGTCVNFTCICDPGWQGIFCHIPASCDGPELDRDSNCCEQTVGILGRCCDGPDAERDFLGLCCTSGNLDACGVCDGTTTVTDVFGTCCNVLDAEGVCCASGLLDQCGVCNGQSNTCGVRLVAEMTYAVGDEDIAVPGSPTREAFEALFAEELSYYLGGYPVELIVVHDVYVFSVGGARRLLSMPELMDIMKARREALADASGVHRPRARHLAESLTLAVDFSVNPPPASSGVEPVTIEQVLEALERMRSDPTRGGTRDIDTLLLRLLATHDPSTHGICGNGICEVGERCVAADDVACCAADCPYILRECLAPSWSDLPCGGHGRCVHDTALCECFAGYVGSDCGECDLGWYLDTLRDRCVPRVFLDESAFRPSPPPSPPPRPAPSPPSNGSGVIDNGGGNNGGGGGGVIEQPKAKKSGATLGALIGIIAAAIALMALACILVLAVLDRKRKRETRELRAAGNVIYHVNQPGMTPKTPFSMNQTPYASSGGPSSGSQATPSLRPPMSSGGRRTMSPMDEPDFVPGMGMMPMSPGARGVRTSMAAMGDPGFSGSASFRTAQPLAGTAPGEDITFDTIPQTTLSWQSADGRLRQESMADFERWFAAWSSNIGGQGSGTATPFSAVTPRAGAGGMSPLAGGLGGEMWAMSPRVAMPSIVGAAGGSMRAGTGMAPQLPKAKKSIRGAGASSGSSRGVVGSSLRGGMAGIPPISPAGMSDRLGSEGDTPVLDTSEPATPEMITLERKKSKKGKK
eukprot:jgi/Mesvir1/27324/Mv07144-RA.2